MAQGLLQWPEMASLRGAMSINKTPEALDEQELKIAKALIRNPRLSDNRLGEHNGIPVRTVSRKRDRMERAGLLRYYSEVDMSAEGTGTSSAGTSTSSAFVSA